MNGCDVLRVSLLGLLIHVGIGQSVVVYGADGNPPADPPPMVRSATEVDATWNGGTGDWTTANWTFDPANGFVEPNNTANHLFSVYIDGGLTGVDSLVSLNANRSIQRLNLDAGDRLTIINSRRLSLFGDMLNHGLLRVGAVNLSTYLQPVGTVTLSGTGVVELGGIYAQFYDATDSNNAPDHLIQSAGHSIRGISNIGSANTLQITNHGLIHSDAASGVLIITPNSDGMSNTGTLRASGGGTLNIITSHGSLSSLIANQLLEGSYEVIGDSTMRLGAAVDSNDATILLDGPLSRLFSTGSTNALANFDSNQGSFTIRGGRGFSTVGGFSNSGLLRVGTGSTFNVAVGNTLFSSGELAGSGTIVGEVVNSGLLTPGDSIGTLTIEGELQINDGSSYDWQIDDADSDLVQVVNGGVSFSGGTVTINVLLGDLPPPIGQDHVLINVSGGVIDDSDLPHFILNMPASWTSDGVQITNTQVLLKNLLDVDDIIFRSRFER